MKDSIKLDFQDIGWEEVDRILLGQDGGQVASSCEQGCLS